ncbi:MAG: hypothetical protein MJ246_00465 [Clostridia bacterium]|nr:hypothetical protein [Clostridia bacterium]
MKSKLELTKEEKRKIFIKEYILVFCISLLFYRNILISLIAGFAAFAILKVKIKEEVDKKKDKLLNDFKIFLSIYSSASSTGDEPFTALKYAYFEFTKLNGEEGMLARSLKELIDKNNIYQNFGSSLLEFADEYNIREINNFAETTNIALKSFGNISDILTETTSVISKRIELDFEIKKMFYEKKFELRLLIIIPIMIYAFLSLTANEYLSPMYTGISGYLVITATLLLLLASYMLGSKMMGVDLNE